MAAISFKRSSLEDFNKYNSLLVGNAFTPPPVPSAYDLLETQVLASNASSVTFTGLGSYTDYKHLQIRATMRCDRSSDQDTLSMQFNSDTSSSYRAHWLVGTGSSVVSDTIAANEIYSAKIPTNSSEASNVYSVAVIDILDFSSTSKNTTTRTLSGYQGTASVSQPWPIGLFSGLYNNTSAITSVELYADLSNLVAGSRFSLYGIKAA